MGSRLKSSTQRALDLYLRMEAIKKKMQAMMVEKDNACDRCDACEEASKVAKLRAEKAEEEVLELMNKARQLETELDVTAERLSLITLQLEEKEKSLMAAEAEVNALNRRVQGLEEDLEKTEEKLLVANQKVRGGRQEAPAVRGRPREGRGESRDRRDQDHGARGGVGSCCQQPQVSRSCRGEGQPEGGVLQGADQDPHRRLKQAEARAEFAEKSVQKLQKEVDRLEDELVGEQEKYKAITEELEQTFAEMSGY